MDETVMFKYLSWVHEAVNTGPFALVLDSFPAHVTHRVRIKAE
jgi:hypothetical protein